MEQRGPEINSWDELVEKVIEAVRSWLVSTGHSGYHRICQLLRHRNFGYAQKHP